MYKPPFSITETMLSRSISITEKLARITSFQSLKRMPMLRRNSKIRSIHSSLAIEANSLSLEEVRDVIAGKTVIGPQKDIQEVKNAFKAYEMMGEYDPYSELDLLKAHRILTYLLIDDAGTYRNHGEGVYDGEDVIFFAPSENMVPRLMRDLFEWLKGDKETPLLVKSCVFHYEFVFIHPFSDGNGRVARLWQNAILRKWNPLFEYIPIESQIRKYQAEYYGTISRCHKKGNSDEFIVFMLKVIDETLDDILLSVSRETSNISDQVTRLLEIMEPGIPISANEIMARLGIKSKETLRHSYLDPALENGLVKMTLPDKRNSKNQRYVKTGS